MTEKYSIKVVGDQLQIKKYGLRREMKYCKHTLSARLTCPLIPLTVRMVAPSNFATSRAELNIPCIK